MRKIEEEKKTWAKIEGKKLFFECKERSVALTDNAEE